MKRHTFTYNSTGYMIYRDGKPIGGVGTRGTASHTSDGRKRHWKHRRADLLMYRDQAQRECDRLDAQSH